MTSRTVRFHRLGGPEVLQLDNLEVPSPVTGEVRIKVKAIGLNRAEALFRKGNYLQKADLPSKLGYEAAGLIDAVGPGVTDLHVGDAVSVVPPIDQGKYGTYGEVVIVPAKYVVKHPPKLSFVEAAAIWMQYLTAYGALVGIAKIKKGDFVVITAASSSVGIAAIQICNMIGAIPIATTRMQGKKRALEEAGAKHVIVREDENLLERLKAITGHHGAKVVFDCVGGKGVADLAEGMARGGTLLIYGSLSLEPTPFPLGTALRKGLTLRGYTLFEVVEDPTRFEEAKKFVLAGLASGALKPVISITFPLAYIVEAHRYLESNQQFGKIVVTV